MTLYRRIRYRIRIEARYLFSLWPVAEWLNRRDTTCWARLCSWAANSRLREVRDYLDGGEGCKADAAKDGACYCHKFANSATEN